MRTLRMDKSTLTPFAAITDPELIKFAEEARQFTASFVWCKEVTQGHLVQGLPGVGVFLMELVPARIGVPTSVWAVVSGQPLVRSVCDSASDWQDALKDHVCQVRYWMKAKRSSTSAQGQPSVYALTENIEKQIEARLASFEKILAES